MSAKREMAEIIAALPESTSVEEAFERLYRAFQQKMRRRSRPPLAGALSGQVRAGRLVLDEPCSFPEGTVLALEIADPGDELTDGEREELHAFLSASWASADSIPADRVFSED